MQARSLLALLIAIGFVFPAEANDRIWPGYVTCHKNFAVRDTTAAEQRRGIDFLLHMYKPFTDLVAHLLEASSIARPMVVLNMAAGEAKETIVLAMLFGQMGFMDGEGPTQIYSTDINEALLAEPRQYIARIGGSTVLPQFSGLHYFPADATRPLPPDVPASDFTVVRHPHVWQGSEIWEKILATAWERTKSGGYLLITCFDGDEQVLAERYFRRIAHAEAVRVAKGANPYSPSDHLLDKVFILFHKI